MLIVSPLTHLHACTVLCTENTCCMLYVLFGLLGEVSRFLLLLGKHVFPCIHTCTCIQICVHAIFCIIAGHTGMAPFCLWFSALLFFYPLLCVSVCKMYFLQAMCSKNAPGLNPVSRQR